MHEQEEVEHSARYLTLKEIKTASENKQRNATELLRLIIMNSFRCIMQAQPIKTLV